MKARPRNWVAIRPLRASRSGSLSACFAAASRIGGPVTAQAGTAFLDGIHVALLAAAGTVLLAAVAVAVLLPRRGVAVDADRDTADPEVAGVTAPSA
jgi:hypothetical protein